MCIKNSDKIVGSIVKILGTTKPIVSSNSYMIPDFRE